MDFDIQPIEGESYEGRDWGFTISRDGCPRWHVTTGGTGDCWNIEDAQDMEDADVVPLHVCELDEFIAALTALRDSEVHKAHVARWAYP